MIELNKVGIEIDGKVYEMRKMNFGFQRRMIALQTSINDIRKRLAKKHNVSTDKLDGVITPEEQLELANLSLTVQEVASELFVNKEEAEILDHFDQDSLTKLIEALQ
jgi:hypothetical protein